MSRIPADIVCFDCDSTLSAIEGIDELARRAGVAETLAPLTNAAMEGSLPLEEVYRRRMEAILPSRDAIAWLSQRYLDQLVEGTEEVIRTLQARGKSVHIISGGIRQAVLAVGEHLRIPDDHVHAVDIHFDPQGVYAGFDQQSPLARSQGKAEVCRGLRTADQHIVLVGDGVTDLEANEAGVTVIGFGGVVRREIMLQGAFRFIEGPALLEILDLLEL